MTEGTENDSQPASRSFSILSGFNRYAMESYSEKMPGEMEGVSYLQPAAYLYKFYARNLL